MLPSMPIIFSSSRQASPEHDVNTVENERNKSNENGAQKPDIGFQILNLIQANQDELPSKISEFDCLQKDDKEVVSLAESLPLSEKRKLLTQVPQSKKKKKLDVNHTEIAIEEKSLDDYADQIAEAFFYKAKSILEEQIFQKFIALLSEAVDEPGGSVALYKKLITLLVDYPELADDFVGFLHPHQAQECGKYVDYKYFEKCWTFLRKLEAQHMNRFINSLELQTINRIPSSEALKSSLSPLLKGHQHLTDSFLQLLPDEKPPNCCKEDFEDISEIVVEDGDWECIRIPEHPERNCCQKCCCKCHSAPSHPFCIACNIKFINGQIYVQHGKVLRFARVTFGDVPQMEMLKKLHPSLYSKRRKERKTSTSKPNIAENKEAEEIPEIREIKCEPEDDVGDTAAVEDGNGDIVDISFHSNEERQDEEDDYWGEESSGGENEKSLDSEITSDPDTSDSTRLIAMVAPVSPLANTQDYCTPTSSIDKETKTDTCKEEKLPIPELIIVKHELNESSTEDIKSEEVPKEWTREEDKMILQTFQKEISTEQTFSKISNLMPSRSTDDIQGRFKVLMSLLERMASGSQNSYPL